MKMAVFFDALGRPCHKWKKWLLNIPHQGSLLCCWPAPPSRFYWKLVEPCYPQGGIVEKMKLSKIICGGCQFFQNQSLFPKYYLITI